MTRTGRHALTRGAVVGTALLTSVALAGCGEVANGNSSDHGGSKSSSSPTGTASSKPKKSQKQKPKPSLKLTPNVSDDATDVHVDKQLAVSANHHGKLSSVSVAGTATDHGKRKKVSVHGDLNKSKSAWKASDVLTPSGKYQIHMVGKTKSGKKTKHTTSFSTQRLSSANQIHPNLQSTRSGRVGVGAPVILKFDKPVHDKARFQRRLHVSNSSKQEGTWSWVNDREVHYRPKTWWKSGTKVKVRADLKSVNAGNGKYGQESISTNFTVGKKVHTKVNLNTDTAKVYVDGKRRKKIPISAGKPGDATRSGTTLIMEKHTNYRMTSESVGKPSSGPDSYDLRVAYALRITNSGEFLHSAPWNSGYFGKTNQSHGCTGMSVADAKWIYKHVPIGSPVTTTGSDRKLEKGNGWTDWNQSYASFKKGSAL